MDCAKEAGGLLPPKHRKNRQPFINRQLERFVPDKLSSALDLAFFKAFELVFEKGTGTIEKHAIKRTVSWLTRSMPTPWV